MANLTLNHATDGLDYSEQLTANFVGKVREVTENGVKYLVAKISALNPGVLNGSKGPLLYTPEDTKASTKSWNDVPLVVYHPTDNEGKPVSARADGVTHVGFTRNANFRGKLVVEGWFDAEKTKSTDSRVYDALVNGTLMEVSTGLGTTNEEAPAGSSYLGQLYSHIARNHRPDHLALLPDQRGACSLNDGCGLHVNQAGNDVENCGGKGGTPGPCKGAYSRGEVRGEDVKDHSFTRAKSGKLTGVRMHDASGKIIAEEKVSEQEALSLAKHLREMGSKEVRNSENSICTNCDASGECEECKKKRLKKASDEAEAAAINDGRGLNVNKEDDVENCGGKGGKPGPCPASQQAIAASRALMAGGPAIGDLKHVKKPEDVARLHEEAAKNHDRHAQSQGKSYYHDQNGKELPEAKKKYFEETVPAHKAAAALHRKAALEITRNSEESVCTNCSADGECKAKRLKKMKTAEEPVENEEELVDNELSHDDLRTRLMQLLNERYGAPLSSVFGVGSPINSGNLWINDVFDKDFVYQDGSEQYRLGYKTDLRNDTVTLSEEAPVEVTQRKTYVANERREFLRTLNCGGEGGKPGPCSKSSTGLNTPETAKKATQEAAKFRGRTLSTSGHTKAAEAHENAAGIHQEVSRSLDKQGDPITAGQYARSSKGHADLAKRHRAWEASGKTGSISQGRPITNQQRKQTHNVGLKLVVNSLRKEADMAGKLNAEDRKKLVDGLVENSGFETADTWEEGDREVLNGLSDEKLYGLAVAKQTLVDQQSVVNAVGKHVGLHKLEDLPQAVENAFKPFKKKKDDEEDEDMEDDEEEGTTNADSQIRVPRQLTEKEFLAMAPPSIRADLEFSRATQNKEKQELIGTITANVSGDELDQAVNYLRTKPLPELRIIANVASKPAAPEFDVNVRRSPNYGGMAVPTGNRPTTNKRPGEGPKPVVINWADVAKSNAG